MSSGPTGRAREGRREPKTPRACGPATAVPITHGAQSDERDADPADGGRTAARAERDPPTRKDPSHTPNAQTSATTAMAGAKAIPIASMTPKPRSWARRGWRPCRPPSVPNGSSSVARIKAARTHGVNANATMPSSRPWPRARRRAGEPEVADRADQSGPGRPQRAEEARHAPMRRAGCNRAPAPFPPGPSRPNSSVPGPRGPRTRATPAPLSDPGRLPGREEWCQVADQTAAT